MNRRNFIKSAGAITALGASALEQAACTVSESRQKVMKPFRITATDSNFEREPLIRPFGFKGGYVNEIWQTAAMLQNESGIRKTGICVQNIL